MKYREFNNTNEKVSLLGLGCMRFPTTHDEKIDEKKALEIIDYAYGHGVNYFDTAIIYHDGESEKFIGRALKKYPRESYNFANKISSWCIEENGGVSQYFEKQLKRCSVDYFDYYLCHSVTANSFDKVYEKENVFDYLLKMKQEGKIRHIGFSFHDTPEVLERIIDVYPWEFVQIQLNYLDWDLQNAKKQYEIIESRGIQCIVMEPVRGGALADLCVEANGLLKGIKPQNSIASWAIRFAAQLPNVLTVLSGMSNMNQVIDNVNTISNFEHFTTEESDVLLRALDIYRKKDIVSCTGCRYCMDCPFGVNIPDIFSVYNEYAFNKDEEKFILDYDSIGQQHGANMCTKCEQCMSKCPQQIAISDKLKKIDEIVCNLKK